MESSLRPDVYTNLLHIEENATDPGTGMAAPNPGFVYVDEPPIFLQPKRINIRTYRLSDQGIAFIPASRAIEKGTNDQGEAINHPDEPYLDMFGLMMALALEGEATPSVQCEGNITVSEVFFNEMINIEYSLHEGETGPMRVSTRDNRILDLPGLPELAKMWRARIVDSKARQPSSPPEISPRIDSGSDTKICPMCAEEVKAAARICRFCRHEFVADEK